MTVAAVPIAARAAASRGAVSRAGSGKVIEGQIVPSRPAGVTGRNTRTRPRADRASDAATGAGLGQLLGNRASGRGRGSNPVARSTARQLLVAEFVLCMVILGLSPLTDRHKEDGPRLFLRRAAAICVLFFLLGLVSAAGRGATKAAAGFGGLVTLTLLVSERSVFAALARMFNSRRASPDGPGEEFGADVGNVISNTVPNLPTGTGGTGGGAAGIGDQFGSIVADVGVTLGRQL